MENKNHIDFLIDCVGMETGRNGAFPIKQVYVSYSGLLSPGDQVYIDGISKIKGTRLNGGIRFNAKAMDKLCKRWLEFRKGR
jgi:hypothetical protein